MGDEEDRDAIFRRRQRLIAIALAGLATSGCDKIKDMVSPPHPCLSPVTPAACLEAPPCLSPTLDMIPATMDPAPDPGPTPCLEPPMPEPEPEPEPDEAGDTPTAMQTKRRSTRSAGMRPTDDPEASPRPCLSVARPAPCLVPPE